jgi:hypothetical protein
MTTDLALTLLNRAANGAELLSILESIGADDTIDAAQPTLEEIQF